MRPTFDVPHRRVRVEVGGEPRWGRRDGDAIVLDDGIELDEVDALYLAPVEPTKILAVHLTYRSRVEEYAARTPPEPSYFVKPPTTLNGHRRPIRMAKGARFLNYEGELAVVVGTQDEGRRRSTRRSTTSRATRARTTSGCTTSATPIEARCSASRGRTGSFRSGRSSSRRRSSIPTDFTLRTFLNGHVVQETTAGDLLFGVAYQLADLCRTITLEPGDVVLTGTPANSRPMKPGDLVEVEIEGLGRLDEHDRGVGRRSRRARRAAPGLGADAPRRARDPRGRGRAHGLAEDHS